MRCAGCFFFMMVLAMAGCMDTPTLPDEAATKRAAGNHPQESLRAPVTAAQVTESNAYEKAEALEIELSQEEAEETNPQSNKRS
jgi:hypothetical protein